MTLDEAIKHAEEVAEKNERRAESVRNRPISSADFYHEEESCSKCATEHRQLAEWLKELKAHRSAWKKLKNDIVAYHNNYDYDTAMHFLNTVVGWCNDDYDETVEEDAE